RDAHAEAHEEPDAPVAPLAVECSRGRDHTNQVSGPDPGRLADRRRGQLRTGYRPDSGESNMRLRRLLAPPAPGGGSSVPCKTTGSCLSLRHAAVARTDRAGGGGTRPPPRSGPAARATGRRRRDPDV